MIGSWPSQVKTGQPARPVGAGRLFRVNGTFRFADSICMPEGERRMLRKRNIAAVGGLIIALIASAGVAPGTVAKSCADCGVQPPIAAPARECCSISKPPSSCHDQGVPASTSDGCGCHMESLPTPDRQAPTPHVKPHASSMDILRIDAPGPILMVCPAGADPHARDTARTLPPPDEVCVLTTVLLI